ncbi:NAD(P)-binding domain-containing protein [Rhodobacter sp. HX-7-19]|uniref:NAD(P)-binding domain-containing protein n=1 Tax=Paragemmobacter kunshanensis TaxID=2583234 RepID=A0A6M1TS01_9RHOB|nr:NAD(P)-binding domain-containing protein [Rhodobacter kunshanensis]NGQ93069.1 NAD(P)-binding domain-containing protein [Rhodobacter kunshanensis]
MRIAIIGTGNVGGAIARGLTGKGHDLVLGARDPGKVGALAAETGAQVAPPAEAAKRADIVILALPWGAAEAAVRDLGDLAGQTVVDCMNPIGRTAAGMGLTHGHTTSGGEIVQGWLPGALVVKTLNQVGAEIMADTVHLPHPPVMFMAGNDAGAKRKVGLMLADLGFEALDAGDITKARLLEPFGMVWINQALMRGKGRNWAFAAVSA